MLSGANSAISLDPSLTWGALGWWSSLSIFVVAVRLGMNARQRFALLNLMLSICGAVAAFGFVVELFQLRTVGLLPKTYYEGWLTGTFVNRNSAATFIVIGLVIAITLATRESIFHWTQDKILPKLATLNAAFYRAVMYGVAATCLFVALLLTGSRGGIIAGLIGVTSVFVMRVSKRGRFSTSEIAAVLAILAISTVLAMNVIQERSGGAESTSIRLSLYAEAFKAIGDRPILGHGAGTYSSIQPLYHSPSTPSGVIWDNLHSTVLEAIVTLGIPMVLFATMMLAYIFSRLARTWWNTPEEATCLLAVLALGPAILFHSLTDFSLEMQAIAIYAACLVGLGVGEMMSFDAEGLGKARQQGKNLVYAARR
jgi:O-antigen ligase